MHGELGHTIVKDLWFYCAVVKPGWLWAEERHARITVGKWTSLVSGEQTRGEQWSRESVCQVWARDRCLLTVPRTWTKALWHILLCIGFFGGHCLLGTVLNTRVRKRHSLSPHKLRIYNQSSVQPVLVGMFSLLNYFKGNALNLLLKNLIWKGNILNSSNTFYNGRKAVK